MSNSHSDYISATLFRNGIGRFESVVSHHLPTGSRRLSLPFLGFSQTLQIYLIGYILLCHWLEFLICASVNLLQFAAVCYCTFVGKPFDTATGIFL